MRRRWAPCASALLGCWLLHASTPAVGAEEEDTHLFERRKAEATALFRSILRSEPADQPACSINGTWESYPIPWRIGRDHLGSNIVADLVPPHQMASPAEVIDPNGEKGVFCDRKATEAYRSDLAEQRIKECRDNAKVFVRYYQKSVGFPIFDAEYTKAIIFAGGEEAFWRCRQGRLKASGIQGGGEAIIYTKQDGVWRLVTRESLFWFS